MNEGADTDFCVCGHSRGKHNHVHSKAVKFCWLTGCSCNEFVLRPERAPVVDSAPLPTQLAQPTGRRAELIYELLSWLNRAPVDEAELLAVLARRIENGRRVYRAWVAADEARDLTEEKRQELLDGLVYDSMRQLVGKRDGGA